MSSSFDDIMSAHEQRAFRNVFGSDESRPAPGLKSALDARYGSCESTATGNEPVSGASGSFKLSTGEVVQFALFDLSRVMRRDSWHASNETSRRARRGGWGGCAQSAIADLKSLYEEGYLEAPKVPA